MIAQNQHTEREDPIRASAQYSTQVLAASRSVWGSLYNTARSLAPFPSSCNGIRNLLHQTPAIPDHPNVLEIEENGYLFLEGGSQWAINTPNTCDLESTVKTSPTQRILIGTPYPARCLFTESFVRDWKGLGSELDGDFDRANYLAVLVLGWAYVLSARLVELRGTSLQGELLYTDNMALTAENCDPISSENGTFIISVGGVDDAEARWWAAVLATGCGWRANMKRSNGSYYPPWSIHLD
jgi:hypothetical protein